MSAPKFDEGRLMQVLVATSTCIKRPSSNLGALMRTSP